MVTTHIVRRRRSRRPKPAHTRRLSSPLTPDNSQGVSRVDRVSAAECERDPLPLSRVALTGHPAHTADVDIHADGAEDLHSVARATRSNRLAPEQVDAIRDLHLRAPDSGDPPRTRRQPSHRAQVRALNAAFRRQVHRNAGRKSRGLTTKGQVEMHGRRPGEREHVHDAVIGDTDNAPERPCPSCAYDVGHGDNEHRFEPLQLV